MTIIATILCTIATIITMFGVLIWKLFGKKICPSCDGDGCVFCHFKGGDW